MIEINIYKEPKAYSYALIPVLQFLWGRQLDEAVRAYLPALRPSSVRVTIGEINLDARAWRVTIYVAKDTGLISRIEQEVTVESTPLYQNGHDLMCETLK